jgi:lipopolysaccharide transport system permease protein
MFAIGVGLILATLTTFFTDIKYLWGVVIMLLSFLTPLFYPIDIIPEKYMVFFNISPLYAAVSTCRDCVLYNTFPNTARLLYLIICAFASIIIGTIIFYKYQDKFILRL